MEVSTHFISQNKAPQGVTQIGVYGKDGKKKGYIPLGHLALPNIGNKLYSFGAISDIHLGSYVHDTSTDEYSGDEDFIRAMDFFNAHENLDFLCICGDLTNEGKISEYQHYQNIISTYVPNMPVYEISGNHEALEQGYQNKSEESLTTTLNGQTPYTGNDLYYKLEHNGDVFIMIGSAYYKTVKTNGAFIREELDQVKLWLEENKNKRCFVFEHCPIFDASGSAGNAYPEYRASLSVDLLANDIGQEFITTISQYPNVLWFHGHSHLLFESQVDNPIANYDRRNSCHSIHIPSLNYPSRFVGGSSPFETLWGESQGFVVDVYTNHIVLRGIDFVKGKYLPIATYCIDTTFTPV